MIHKVNQGESIQETINVANPGDTIEIADGTYHEVVVLKKNNLHIVGNNVTIDGEYVLPSGNIVRTDPLSGNGFVYEGLLDFRADGCTVDGINLTRSLGRTVRFWDGAHDNKLLNTVISHGRAGGILVDWTDVRNTLLQNVEIFDVSNYAPYSRSAKELDWSSGITIKGYNTTLDGCSIHEVWGEGLIAGRGSDTTAIKNSQIYNNYALQMYVNHAYYVQFLDNEVWFDDPTYNRGGHASWGIVLNNEGNYTGHYSKDILIEGNEVSNCYHNFSTWGASRPQTNVTIKNNISREAVEWAFFVSNGDHVNYQIIDNTIYQTDETKIWAVPDLVIRSGNIINPEEEPAPEPDPEPAPEPHIHQDVLDRLDTVEESIASQELRISNLEQAQVKTINKLEGIKTLIVVIRNTLSEHIGI